MNTSNADLQVPRVELGSISHQLLHMKAFKDTIKWSNIVKSRIISLLKYRFSRNCMELDCVCCLLNAQHPGF